MAGSHTAAFAELIRLDPVAPTCAQATVATPELLLARILSTPRPAPSVMHHRRRATRSARQHPRRIELAGMAVSLAMAVVALLLWASPSAGALHGRAASPAPAVPWCCPAPGAPSGTVVVTR